MILINFKHTDVKATKILTCLF